MAKTRAYSTRLAYDDPIDKSIMNILDEFPDGGPAPNNPSWWIAEACRERYKRETSPEPVKVDALEDMLLEGLKAEAGVEETPLHSRVFEIINSMNEQDRLQYMLEAIKMRVVLETHAPAFFIGRYYEQQLHSYDRRPEMAPGAAAATMEQVDNVSIVQTESQQLDSLDMHIQEPAIHPYLEKCMNAIPLFLDLQKVMQGDHL